MDAFASTLPVIICAIGVFLSFASFPLHYLLCSSYKLKKLSHSPFNGGGGGGGDSDLRPYPLVGNLPQFLRNRHRFHDWITDVLANSKTNTIIFYRPGNIRGVITANPTNVEHVLRSNFSNYPKGPRVTAALEDFLGHGIFNADGDLWRAQRKISSFEFNTNSLRTFVVTSVRNEIVSRLIPLLKDAAGSGVVVDIQDLLERFAFDNICKVAFNEDPACLNDIRGGVNGISSEFAQAFRDATEIIAGRFRYAVPRFWFIKKVLDVGSERRLRKSIAAVHDFARRIIRQRKEEQTAVADDLLSRFTANKENSDEFLRDIVISFILAGRETTSSALTWFFWLLSQNPEIEKKIIEEIQSIRRRGFHCLADPEPFGFEDLRDMHYLHAAITESMRLYPPVPTNMLACTSDDVLPDGTAVGKGWFISYNSYAMGRMEKIWGEDCKDFKPERWIDGLGIFRQESPFKFPAFNAGPRICLGKEMAYVQMKSIAASVLERFVMEVSEPEKTPEQTFSLTLRMRGGLSVTIKKRAVEVQS